MYEYQKKKIAEIAKSTAEYLGQWVSIEEAPETDPAKIEACMINAVENIAELTEMCFENRHPTAEEKTKAIKNFLSVVLNISHIWRCGYQDHEAELIDIIKDELSERRRDKIRGEFFDPWDDDPDPETADGERQQDLIDAYRRER